MDRRWYRKIALSGCVPSVIKYIHLAFNWRFFGLPMGSAPKPTRSARKADKASRTNALHDYRHTQAALAIERDGDLCIFCYFLDDDYKPVANPPFRIRKRADVHHVYGRGRTAGDWRESHKVLACTCRECHPQPIIAGPGNSPNLAWVEDALLRANTTPINRNFKTTKFP